MSSAATVLIADDQGRFRDTVADALRAAGFHCLLAADGIQALATCRRELPDVVVLDMVMPHMDGIAVCRSLRSDPVLPYIPVIFFSRRDATADRVNALRSGGDDFVAKDVPSDELVARVEALVRIKKMLDARRRTGDAAPARSTRTKPRIATASALEGKLLEEFERALEHNDPLSLIIATMDPPWKPVDDEDISARIIGCARGNDRVTYHDEDGFAVILPNTHFGGAMASAERIWRALPPGGVLPSRGRGSFAGLTIGVACYPNPEISSAEDLLSLARASLDRAGSEGPAHICLYHHQAYIFRPD